MWWMSSWGMGAQPMPCPHPSYQWFRLQSPLWTCLLTGTLGRCHSYRQELRVTCHPYHQVWAQFLEGGVLLLGTHQWAGHLYLSPEGGEMPVMGMEGTETPEEDHCPVGLPERDLRGLTGFQLDMPMWALGNRGLGTCLRVQICLQLTGQWEEWETQGVPQFQPGTWTWPPQQDLTDLTRAGRRLSLFTSWVPEHIRLTASTRSVE